MNSGKTLFAQLMDFLPWSTFTRIVSRYGGDWRVRTLSCAEQYRAMAFAQLTYRESLRDIETCLSAQAAKLYAMGFGDPVRRSTLADANEARDWRIYAELAQRLIVQARRLYTNEDLGFDLANTVYALDSTTIDLCLAVFPWAHFRTSKAAVKMHTLLDLRGNIPSFIHVSKGKLHDVHTLDCVVRAGELVRAGAIGTVVNTVGLGPHRIDQASRPGWSFERERYGGILADIASHQIEQFLFFTGAEDAEVAVATVANRANLGHPELQDFGDMLLRTSGVTGYVRVDWLTPDGLPTWGDGRLVIVGTEGTIEMRKYIDIGGRRH